MKGRSEVVICNVEGVSNACERGAGPGEINHDNKILSIKHSTLSHER